MRTAVSKYRARRAVAKERSLVGKEWRRKSWYLTESIVNRKQAATEEIDGLENIAVVRQVPAVWRVALLVDIEDSVAMTGVLTSRFHDSAPGGVGSGFVAAVAAGGKSDDPS